MSLVAFIDAVFVLSSGAALLFVLRNLQWASPGRGNRLLLACLIFCTLVYSLCLFAEWSRLYTGLDEFEDIIGALLPMWWAFVLYGFVKETAQRDLRESEQKFRAIFDQTFQFTGLLDLEGKVMAANKTALAASGVQESDVLGKPFWETIWWSHSKELQQKARDAVERTARGEFIRFETTHPGPDGSLLHVDFSLKPVRDDTGRVVMLIPEGRDITERKSAEEAKAQIERQLRQARKMEAIGTLAGGIAHDFNNILMAVFGNVGLAKMKTVPEDPLYKYLDDIEKAAVRAKELVEQILTFSRKRERDRHPLRVDVILREALKLLRSTIPVTIEIKDEIVSQGTVLADPTQLHQVIMNLCMNASRAMREKGGSLHVVLREVDTTTDDITLKPELRTGRYVQLEISDTGSGMDRETRDKIFEPYFTTNRSRGGTGLGLAVVHGIVKAHHGYITVDSEPGQGTIFRVYLPACDADTVTDEMPSEPEILAGGSEHLMFVDDEETNTAPIKEILTQHGYQVDIFTSGVQAWEEFQKQPDRYDLVITDMTMPSMTGTELAQKIMTLRPDLPIILCTGYSELVSREQARAMGISDYIQKPMSMRRLTQSIRTVLEKSRIPVS
jgi:PAS domain S-box-containing protein